MDKQNNNDEKVIFRADSGDFQITESTRQPSQRPPQGATQRPLQGTSQRPPQGTSQRPPQGTAQRPPQGTAQRPPQGTAQRPPQGTAQRPPQGASQRPLQGTAQRPPQGTSQRPPQGTAQRPPQGTAQRPPQGTAQRPPQGTSQRPPQGTSQRPPQGASQRPPQGASQRPPQGASQRPPHGASRRPPQGTQQRSDRPSAPAGAEGAARKKKKRGKIAAIVLPIVLLLVIGGLLTAFVVIYANATYEYYTGPDRLLRESEPRVYTVTTEEELIKYLTHPSLLEGDTITVSGDYVIDLPEKLGGFLSMGLVNFDCSAGSVTFSGGTVLMASGREERIDMSGVSFSGTELFIEAGGVDLVWPEAPDANRINAKTLNGAANLNTLSVPAPGAKMTIPVTLQNLSGAALTDVEVKLISPSFLFHEGETVKASIPAGGSVTIDVNVIVLEGGKAAISAIGVDAAGNKVIEGKSDYIDLLGGGFYTGDPHTHTTAGWTDRADSTIEKNIQYAAEKGLSYIVSFENDVFAEKLPQSEIDAITGGKDFLQLTGLEPGQSPELRHFLVYNYTGDTIPNTDYGSSDLRKRTLQDAINDVLTAEGQEDAFIYIPHPFGYGVDLQGAVNNIMSLMGYNGIEVLDQTSFSDSVQHTLTVNIWNNLNVFDRLRAFGIGTSNNIYSEYVGSRYTRGYMDSLTEENILNMLRRTGNMFASNGPELRFTLGNTPMGGDLYLNPGEEIIAEIYASAKSPLTSVALYRYDIDGNWENLEADAVLLEDLSGQGLYEYQVDLPVTPATTLKDDGTETVNYQFYRLEVKSESADYYEDIGLGYSNPVWVDQAMAGSNDTTMLNLSYQEKPVTVLGLDIDLSFLNGIVEKIKGEQLYGMELFTTGNGSRYFAGEGVFTINAFSASAKDNQLVTIDYHRYNSDVIADKITVMVMAEDRLETKVETIYLLDKLS